MDNATIVWVNQRPLNDDILLVADNGYQFKGGYVARLEYFTYRNPNADDAHVRHFKTIEAAERYIAKHYGEDE